MVGTLELRILPALAKINLIQAITYILVLVPALHMLGVTGGVGARVVSFLVYIVVQNWVLSRIVGFKFRSSIWPGTRMLLACLAVGALYHRFVFPLFPLSVTWFLFYFAGLSLVSYGVAIFCLGRLARRVLAVLGRRSIKGLQQARMRRRAG
jgi:O-antigen/teichoic acid export membrane protein